MKKLLAIVVLFACSCKQPEPETAFQKRMLGNLQHREIDNGITILPLEGKIMFSHETSTRVSIWETTNRGALVAYKSYPLCDGQACGTGEILQVENKNKEEKFRTAILGVVVEFNTKTRAAGHPDIQAEQERLNTFLKQIPPAKQ